MADSASEEAAKVSEKQKPLDIGGAGVSAGSPRTDASRPSEREVAAKNESEYASDESIIQMNAMLARVPAHERERLRAQGLELDDRVAPFHIEFERARGWPAGCNAAACRRKLLMAYESSRMSPMRDNLMLKAPKLAAPPNEVAARVGGHDIMALMWLATAKPGDVRQQVKKPYDSRIFHSFSNEDCLVMSVTPEKTQVAVGFVDLGTLGTFDEQYGPLRWVGVEASPYAVAKTAVLDAMLRAQASEDAILEVWYSSAWSAATLTAFRSAVDHLLRNGGADNERGARARHQDVAALLEAWRSADVSLEQSRATWLKETTRKWAEIGDYSRKEDRNALCAYMLTGQLLDGATVGSVCMFVTPPGFQAKRSLDESIFHCVPPQAIWEFRSYGALNMVAAAAKYLRKGVTRIRNGVAAGQLTIELMVEHLSLDNRAALARVAALQPGTVSWSNVCDYTTFKEFHAVARARLLCSRHHSLRLQHELAMLRAFRKRSGLADAVRAWRSSCEGYATGGGRHDRRVSGPRGRQAVYAVAAPERPAQPCGLADPLQRHCSAGLPGALGGCFLCRRAAGEPEDADRLHRWAHLQPAVAQPWHALLLVHVRPQAAPALELFSICTWRSQF